MIDLRRPIPAVTAACRAWSLKSVLPGVGGREPHGARRWGRLVGLFGGLLVMAAASPRHGQDPTQPRVTAFVHVAVIPMDRERVLPDQTVLVQDDRIVALGPAGQIAVPDGAVRIDGRRQFLMPGLADMHVHFHQAIAWNSVAAGGSRSRLRADFRDTRERLFSYVANGVTTVRDMHSGKPWTGDSADAWLPMLRRRIASGELVGPRIYGAGDPDISSSAAAAKSVAALKAAGYDYVKYYNYPRSIYDSMVAAARRVDLPIVGHTNNYQKDAADLTDVFKDKDVWASVEHMSGYFQYGTHGMPYDEAHLSQLDPKGVPDSVLQRMAQETKRAGIWNCPTLAIYRDVLFFPAADLWKAPRQNTSPRMVKALQDVGAGLLLGTDGSMTVADGLLWSGFAIHRELEALVEAGLTPYQALATGTINVARFLGTEDSTGTVAVGKRADLVLLKANPLEDIHSTAALAGVMVGGHWLSRADLERWIDTLPAVPGANAVDSASVATWGTTAVQMRILKQLVWR